MALCTQRRFSHRCLESVISESHMKHKLKLLQMRSVVTGFIKPKPNPPNTKMWARLTLQPNYTYTNVIINVFNRRDSYKASAPEFSIQIVSVCPLTRPPTVKMFLRDFSELPVITNPHTAQRSRVGEVSLCSSQSFPHTAVLAFVSQASVSPAQQQKDSPTT